MTEAELKFGVQEGWIDNQVYLFATSETIAEAKRIKICRTVMKLAWKKYVAAVINIPFPDKRNNVKLFKS